MQATAKATNVTKAAKRAGKAHPTIEQAARNYVACWQDYAHADRALDHAKALWDAARISARMEVQQAVQWFKGAEFDRYKAHVRAELVKANVCANLKAAGRMLNNQLIALGLVGNGARKGGKRKGAGRKEKSEPVQTVLSEKDVTARLLRASAWCSEQQMRHVADPEVLELLGELAAILSGSVK